MKKDMQTEQDTEKSGQESLSKNMLKQVLFNSLHSGMGFGKIIEMKERRSSHESCFNQNGAEKN
jgi:hypothetical protein